MTTREKEIFELLLQGYANKIIADRLFISDNTLKSHLKKIYRKFGVLNKNELLAFVTGRKPS
ncbi:MAG TPA: helix-turn-helix transcriptional regulator [Candidatus Limnocylindrales bacterium]|nr:helix-turn-helix transcriptional regulator [Candidatus Limnocylindrales bacterium]